MMFRARPEGGCKRIQLLVACTPSEAARTGLFRKNALSPKGKRASVLFDFYYPTFRSFDLTHLDSGKRLTKLRADRTHLGHAARQENLIAVVVNAANRGDNRCGTAETALCEILKFVNEYLALLNLHAENAARVALAVYLCRVHAKAYGAAVGAEDAARAVAAYTA